MSLVRLLLANLLYHRLADFAVLLGVAVGATVLTGALLVGDSLRGSLRVQSELRLGWVDHALVAPRFYRQALAAEVAKSAHATVAPALLLQATCAAGEKAEYQQMRGVTILGVEKDFFGGPPPAGFGAAGMVWINRPVAEELHVEAGSKLTLRLEKPGELPREAGLGKKDVTFDDWELTVAAVLEDDFAARFNLRPELTPPRNVIVSLPQLQEQLNLPGQVNAMLAAGQTDALGKALREHLTLEDWGLSLLTSKSRAKALIERYDIDHDGKLIYSEWISTRSKGKDLPKYAWVIEENTRPAQRRFRTEADLTAAFERMGVPVTLQSKQLLIPPSVADAALKVAKQMNLDEERTLVYLCRIDAGGKRIAGVVAAVDSTMPPRLVFETELKDDEIFLLNEGWASPGPTFHSPVTLRFKPPETHGPVGDVTATFKLARYVAPTRAAADPTLTPDFPGITDKDDIGTWDLPFEDADWKKHIAAEYGDAFWKRFRGTPKAFITLAAGQKLWGSRFGDLTSIRLLGAVDADAYAKRLLAELKPATGGFVFDPTLASAMQASQGGTPFGLLFLGFSSFLIASALLLVGLLYRLDLERRARELGVLFAEGFPRRTVGRLLLGEGGVLALVGVGLGCVLALAYSRLLVGLLAALWPGGALQSFLRPHATQMSLLAGGGGAFAVSLLTVWWVVRALSKVPPRALLAGQTTDESAIVQKPTTWISLTVLLASALLGVGLLVAGPCMPGQEAQAGTFFTSGMLLLTAGLVALFRWMKRPALSTLQLDSVGRLGVRNAARHPTRSLLTVGLLASAAFLIVAVESFRRTVPASDGTPAAADGGFALLGESDLPLIRDPNTPAGRAELLAGLKAWLARQGVTGAEQEMELTKAGGLLEGTTIVPLRTRAGDDASCLNLYKPRSPRVLGVPRSLIERGGFVFDGTAAKEADEKKNPWLILLRPGDDVPAFGEANTVAWMLHSGLGGSVKVPDGRGVEVPLVISGLLHDSVFQSSLLVSEERFLSLYPGHEGYNTFLIRPPEGKAVVLKELLQHALGDRGLEVSSTAEKLAAYLSVENTYLTTFQALGGLGLVLGSLGLAVVLLRSIWERRAELALLRALGYRRSAIGWLVLSENAFLLAAGLVIGAVSALLSILPQLLGGQGAVPWANLALLFAGLLAVALAAGLVAVMGTLRSPLVPALRRE